MGKRDQLIAEARTWIGTPFGHQGRLKGLFADCIGVHLCAARAVGLLPPNFDYRSYRPDPDPPTMERLLDENLDRVPKGEELAGDVAWMADPQYGGKPRHIVLLTEKGTIIHAHSDVSRGPRKRPGKVIEGPFSEAHRHAVKRFYRFRGIDD